MAAELVARRVLDVVGRQAGLSASIGVAVSAPGETDALALMARADALAARGEALTASAHTGWPREAATATGARAGGAAPPGRQPAPAR